MKKFILKIYQLLAYVYLYLIIFPTSIIINLFYFIKYIRKTKRSNIILKYKSKTVTSMESALYLLKEIIPKKHYDLFGGVLNWVSLPLVTYLRHKNEKVTHSMDCFDNACLLRYIFKNANMDIYKKIELKVLLSIKPFIRMNHTILLAYRKDKRIDVYTPYSFYTDIDIEDQRDLPKLFQDIYKEQTGKEVIYSDYMLTLPI